MDYCGPRGIPHDKFLGWPKTTRDKHLAWFLRHRVTCPSCGTRPEEWDPNRGGSRDAYRADFHECPGCVERQRAEDSPELKEQRGLSIVLIKNKRA